MQSRRKRWLSFVRADKLHALLESVFFGDSCCDLVQSLIAVSRNVEELPSNSTSIGMLCQCYIGVAAIVHMSGMHNAVRISRDSKHLRAILSLNLCIVKNSTV